LAFVGSIEGVGRRRAGRELAQSSNYGRRFALTLADRPRRGGAHARLGVTKSFDRGFQNDEMLEELGTADRQKRHRACTRDSNADTKKTGPNPTDRGKRGTKRSVLTDAAGIPIGLAVDGANRIDFKMARETIENLAIERSEPTRRARQGLCLDRGYDSREVRELADEFGFTAHIRCRGEEAKAIEKAAGFKARRWVVERAHSWMNRFRRILVRWEKRADTYVAMLHLACGLITWKACGILG
jgi:transposase